MFSLISVKGSAFLINKKCLNVDIFKILLNRLYSTQPKNLIVETKGEKQNIGFIRINKPKTLNALSQELMHELSVAVNKFDKDPKIACMVLTGTDKVFSIGASIKELRNQTLSNMYSNDLLKDWSAISLAKKPILAAVNGYALGGGCELALMCDIILAGEKAEFGQPEIIIGTIPGSGGTQRLIRVVGKSKAMEMVLTGNRINALEALSYGIVSGICPSAHLLNETFNIAERIAANSKIIVQIAKEAVNSAYETTLKSGLQHERKLSHSTFSTNDRQEGMSAFVEKRKPKFTDS